MKNPLLVVVEGVDNVGKTTLARRIAEELEFFYLYTPQPPLDCIRREVEALRDFKTRFFYYLTSVVAVQDAIEEQLLSGKSVVIDRYIYSTVIMHQQLGVNINCVNVRQLPIRWPDVGFLLTAQTDVRELRRKQRGGSVRHDSYLEQLSDFLDKAQDSFRTYTELSAVDTSSFSKEEVFRMVLDHIVAKGG